MFISNRAFSSDAFFAVIKVSCSFLAPEPVHHSIQIRDLLVFAICLRTLELLKTTECVFDHEQTIALLLGVKIAYVDNPGINRPHHV
jgi:hypothetical protein